jgi:hypothetical protein
MDPRRNPSVAGQGNVLLFPSRSEHRLPKSEGARAKEERALRNRQRQMSAWSRTAWLLMAWSVAMFRVGSAIRHREVFGLEASLAFVVVVWMPILYGKSFVGAIRRGIIVVRRKKAALITKREQRGSRSSASPPDPRPLRASARPLR